MAHLFREGIKIYYDLLGEGPPLLLVHGLGQSGQIWQERGYVDRLKSNFTLICPDMRGHGKSDKPDTPDAYRLETFVADLVALLDALSISKVIYFGYSMGGRIGYSFLEYASERLSLILIGGASHLERPYSRLDIRHPSDFPALHAALNQFVGEPLSEDFLSGRPFDEIHAIGTIISTPWPNLGQGLKNSGVPVQLFCGDRDPRYERVLETARCFSGVEIETLPGATHASALENVTPLSSLLIRRFSNIQTLSSLEG